MDTSTYSGLDHLSMLLVLNELEHVLLNSKTLVKILSPICKNYRDCTIYFYQEVFTLFICAYILEEFT